MYGLIGKGLSHSYSKTIHEYIFKLTNRDESYRIFDVDEEEIKSILNSSDIMGLNITIPYKETIMKYIVPDEKAKSLGAINTIYNGIGYNTDYEGFGLALKREGISVFNKVCTVLGIGGAGKMIEKYLLDNGAQSVNMISRNKPEYLSYEDLADITGNIIINATPVGMYPNVKETPVSADIISRYDIAMDLIYNPKTTRFLSMAKNAGLKSFNGLYMLVAQAVKSHEIWYDIKNADKLIEETYSYILRLERNV